MRQLVKTRVGAQIEAICQSLTAKQGGRSTRNSDNTKVAMLERATLCRQVMSKVDRLSGGSSMEATIAVDID